MVFPWISPQSFHGKNSWTGPAIVDETWDPPHQCHLRCYKIWGWFYSTGHQKISMIFHDDHHVGMEDLLGEHRMIFLNP
jgi:hypothetical protein